MQNLNILAVLEFVTYNNNQCTLPPTWFQKLRFVWQELHVEAFVMMWIRRQLYFSTLSLQAQSLANWYASNAINLYGL